LCGPERVSAIAPAGRVTQAPWLLRSCFPAKSTQAWETGSGPSLLSGWISFHRTQRKPQVHSSMLGSERSSTQGRVSQLGLSRCDLVIRLISMHLSLTLIHNMNFTCDNWSVQNSKAIKAKQARRKLFILLNELFR